MKTKYPTQKGKCIKCKQEKEFPDVLDIAEWLKEKKDLLMTPNKYGDFDYEQTTSYVDPTDKNIIASLLCDDCDKVNITAVYFNSYDYEAVYTTVASEIMKGLTPPEKEAVRQRMNERWNELDAEHIRFIEEFKKDEEIVAD